MDGSLKYLNDTRVLEICIGLPACIRVTYSLRLCDGLTSMLLYPDEIGDLYSQ